MLAPSLLLLRLILLLPLLLLLLLRLLLLLLQPVSVVGSDTDEVILAAVTKLEREGMVNALSYLL